MGVVPYVFSLAISVVLWLWVLRDSASCYGEMASLLDEMLVSCLLMFSGMLFSSAGG